MLFIFTTERRNAEAGRFFLLHSTATAGKVINFNTAGGDFDPKQESLVEVLIYFWKVTMALITPPQV